ncbi:MAG: 30S ribosomal protein S8 [Planctomycetota bacterium]
MDTVSNFIISLKNAYNANHSTVNTPYSKLNEAIAGVLKREGYIKDYQVIELRKNIKELRIYLKYGPNGEKVFSDLRRISKPGRRIYTSVSKIPRVNDGLGIAVLSTDKGVMSDREARKANAGGEILFYIW